MLRTQARAVAALMTVFSVLCHSHHFNNPSPINIQLITRNKGHVWGHFTPGLFKIHHGYLIKYKTNPHPTHQHSSSLLCHTLSHCLSVLPLLDTSLFSLTGSTVFSEGKSPHHHSRLQPLHNPPECLVSLRIHCDLYVHSCACLSI